MGASVVLASAIVPRADRPARRNRRPPTSWTSAPSRFSVPRIPTVGIVQSRSSCVSLDDTRRARSLGGVPASSSSHQMRMRIQLETNHRVNHLHRDVSTHARRDKSTSWASSAGTSDDKKPISTDFMDDFTTQFPQQMEELRLRVQKDVRKNLRAAKHLLAAQMMFVSAIVLVKQSLTHFTPAGFLVARALVSLPLIYVTARWDETSCEAFGLGKGGVLRNPLISKQTTQNASMPTKTSTTKLTLSTLLNSWYVRGLGVLVLLGQVFTILGLERVSISNTVVLGQLVPVYSLLIAVFQGVEVPSVSKFVSIGLGVLGAAVMLDPSNMWLSSGNVFLLLRSAVFAGFLALQAPALFQFKHGTVVAVGVQLVSTLLSVAIGIPFAILKTGQQGGALYGGGMEIAGLLGNSVGTPLLGWVCVIGVVLTSTTAYLLTAKAEKNTTPVVTACYNSMQPIFALLLLCALGEAPGARNLTGSFLILLGGIVAVALSTNDKRRWKRWYAGETWGAEGGEGDTGAVVTVVTTVSSRVRLKTDEKSGGTEMRSRKKQQESVQLTPARGGTVRIVRPRSDKDVEPVKITAMAWTVVWAAIMSLCALAGGGLLTWSLVWVYWKLLL